jgi:hypothetical protein
MPRKTKSQSEIVTGPENTGAEAVEAGLKKSRRRSTDSAAAPAKPRRTVHRKSSAQTAAEEPLVSAPAASQSLNDSTTAVATRTLSAPGVAEPSQAEIAQLAYSLWLEHRTHGRELEDWLRAEEQLKLRAASAAV